MLDFAQQQANYCKILGDIMGWFLFFVIIGVLWAAIQSNNAKRKPAVFEKSVVSGEKHAEFVKSVTARIKSITSQHIGTLALKWDQTVYQDEYGNYLFDRWNQALDYFIDNVLRKDSLISGYLFDSSIARYRAAGINMDDIRNKHLAQIKKIVVDAIIEYKTDQLENNAHLSVHVDSLDPIQFEHYCADILRSNGWDARVTQASGDQGIDVIASLGNVKAVLQCKKYSQPVGNAAVQEIFAGKQHEQAHVAAVVSNATFTPSAKQLASSTGVHLLHYSELAKLAQKLGIAGLTESQQGVAPLRQESPTAIRD